MGDDIEGPVAMEQNSRDDISIMLDRSLSVNQRRQAQRRLELKMVESELCPSEIVSDLRVRIFQLDAAAIMRSLRTQRLFDANLHQYLSCVADAVVYTQPGTTLSPYMRERVRNWFTYLRRIGDKSVEGYALAPTFSGQDDLFLFKTPRRPDRDDLPHEALIGFYVTNKLRAWIPNFMYVYSLFSCSPPLLPGEEREPVTWCSSTDSGKGVTYLVLENIRESHSLGEHVRTCDSPEFLRLYLQVLNALSLAYKNNDFTHYDLHGGNVLVRQLDSAVSISYLGGEGGYLISTTLAVIIDYGYAHADIQGVPFGKLGLEKGKVYAHASAPMYDAYKLLCFCAESAYRNKNARVSRAMSALYRFFEAKGGLTARITKRLNTVRGGGKDYYTVPDSHRHYTYDQYLHWIEANVLPSFGKRETYIVSSTPERAVPTAIPSPLDYRSFLSRYINDLVPPETTLEFCDALSALSESGLVPTVTNQVRDWLTQAFDAVTAVDREGPLVQLQLQEAQGIFSRVLVPDLQDDSRRENVFLRSYTQRYSSQLLLLARGKDLLALIYSWYRSATCSLQAQGAYATYANDLQEMEKDVLFLRDRYQVELLQAERNQQSIDDTDFSHLPYSPSPDVSSFYKQVHADILTTL